MPISFFVLYQCLFQGLTRQAPGAPCLVIPDDRAVEVTPLNGAVTLAATTTTQPYNLYGADSSSARPSQAADANNNRDNILPDNRPQVALEVENHIASDYAAQSPNSLADTSSIIGYSQSIIATSAAPYNRSQLHLVSLRRNCHIIKCPKFVRATYGSDGSKCQEFHNQCFMAVASCKRHNDRLPRFKEISKKHCDTLK